MDESLVFDFCKDYFDPQTGVCNLLEAMPWEALFSELDNCPHYPAECPVLDVTGAEFDPFDILESTCADPSLAS